MVKIPDIDEAKGAPKVEVIDPAEESDEDSPAEFIEVGDSEATHSPDESIAGLAALIPTVQRESPDDSSAGEDRGASSVALLDPLQRYLNEIRNIPPLSREEEHELAVKFFKNKDQAAGYRLILANLRLVVMVAREYQRNVGNILDLVQEGNIGLLEAIQQYDPFRGIRFPSYAVYWIRAYMLRHLINNIRLVKVGTTQAQRKLFFNLQKEKEKLEAEGFVPEAKLLAQRLSVKESEVVEMEQRLALPDLSVDAPLGSPSGDDYGGDLHGILPSPGPNVEEQVVQEQFADSLRKAVDDFKLIADEKERAIIERRLFTEEPQTLQEIADEFGLSRERIRQIENRLKERLKSFLAERLGLGDDGEVEVGLSAGDEGGLDR